MTQGELYVLLAVGTAVVLISVAAARIASRAGIPVLLAYLAVGLLVGEEGLGIRFDNAALAQSLALAALSVILVEGGITTKLSDFRPVFAPAAVLATLGVFISVAVTAVATYILLDVSWQLALLLGSIVSSTDAAATFAVLRSVPLPRRLSGLLEAESGLNDAPTVILVTTFSVATLSETNIGPLALSIIYQYVVGVVLGLGIGAGGAWVLRRLTLPTSGLYPIATVSVGILAFGVAGLLNASAIVAAYLAGLVLGNSGLRHRRATQSVAEGLGWIAQIGLFVLLGLLATPSELIHEIGPALAVGGALLLLARPISVMLPMMAFRMPLRDQIFVSWAGLRGAVPIVLGTYPVVANVPGSERVFNLVFVLVVMFTLIQAPVLPWLSRRLKVAGEEISSELQVELAPLDTLDADLIHVTVEEGSRLRGAHISELRLPSPAVATLVVRDGTALVPGPDTRLRTGDQLLVMTTPDVREATERRLRAVSRAGRLARWFGEGGEPNIPVSPTSR